MKKILALFLLLGVTAGFCVAQNNLAKADDFGRIILTAYLSKENTKIPPSALNILKNKLSQIVTQNGMGGSIQQRFIITANSNLLSQDITPTAPPMHAYTVEITFYIGDGVDGTLFSSVSKTVKGVGETPDKAYIAALKNVKSNDPEFAAFVTAGKNRIIEYYNSNGDMLIKKALTCADNNEFDEAIYELMSIPEVCKDVYDRAMDAVAGVYQRSVNYESGLKLAEAKAVWSAGLDYDAAEKASKILALVDPSSDSYPGAIALNNEIAGRLRELDSREWQFRLTEQQDAHSERMAEINACREVAVARAKNQPKTIIYNNYLWW